MNGAIVSQNPSRPTKVLDWFGWIKTMRSFQHENIKNIGST
jgi:hypothetical protein